MKNKNIEAIIRKSERSMFLELLDNLEDEHAKKMRDKPTNSCRYYQAINDMRNIVESLENVKQ
jgi:pyruvate/oxaloacetate carboxyltransferase